MLVCQACPSAEVAGHVNKPHNYILTDEELAHATKTRPERERGPYIWGTPENPAECMGTSLLNAPLSADVSACSFTKKAQFVSHRALCTIGDGVLTGSECWMQIHSASTCQEQFGWPLCTMDDASPGYVFQAFSDGVTYARLGAGSLALLCGAPKLVCCFDF